jgi:hypothetical protein
MNFKLIFFIFALLYGFNAVSNESSQQKNCLDSNDNNWTDCVGSKIMSNGDVYVGRFVNGKFNGFGKYTSKNKFTYTGNWVDGMPHGLGLSESPNGEPAKEGKWEFGRFLQAQDTGLKRKSNFTNSEFIVECRYEKNILNVTLNACTSIGGDVVNENQYYCIIGNNKAIKVSPQKCLLANGRIVGQ